jgi:hypothetical protein
MTTIASSASMFISTVTSSSSTCHTVVDVTSTGCYTVDFTTTTTTSVTKSNSLSLSDAPACTRAPLSLDDDEGANKSIDLSSSISYSSNITSASSTSSSTSSSSSTPASTTPSSTPTPGPMDKNGVWKVSAYHWMEGGSSKSEWKLWDPNGNNAGEGKMMPKEGTEELTGYIESQARPFEHSMPYGVH